MAYSQSKMANVLHAVGLAQRLVGTGVTANAVHPGVIRTEVFRDVSPEEEQMVTGWAAAYGSPLKSIGQGAATTVWAATAPELADVTGVYLEDCAIAQRIPATTLSAIGVVDEAYDVDAANRLWAISEKMTGQGLA
jgi:NAD(P)-dependent dehydrogenase (short-subunit alcohol dehydrogenase family)